MKSSTVFLLLAASAVLEVGGNAFMRSGPREPRLLQKIGLVLLGVLHGFWEFYIAVFFVVAQLIAWLVFQQKPDWGVMAGGALIVACGVIVSWTAAVEVWCERRDLNPHSLSRASS